jgi:predicted transcriptional regulator
MAALTVRLPDDKHRRLKALALLDKALQKAK